MMRFTSFLLMSRTLFNNRSYESSLSISLSVNISSTNHFYHDSAHQKYPQLVYCHAISLISNFSIVN